LNNNYISPKPQPWGPVEAAFLSFENRELFEGVTLAFPFWNFKESHIQDVSGNNLHGAFQAGIDPLADWSHARWGETLEFDGGTTDYIVVPDPSSDIIDGTSKITIALLVRTSIIPTLGQIQGLISKYAVATGKRSWRLYFEDNEIEFQVSSDGANNETKSTSGAAIGQSVWYFIVITFDAGVFKVYIDGKSVTVGGNFTITNIFNGTEPIWIGRRSSGDPFFGEISMLAVWGSRVLNPAEVETLSWDIFGMFELDFQRVVQNVTMITAHSGGVAAGPWISAGKVAETGPQEKLITGLTNGVLYDVQVKTIDDDGNVSAGSTIVQGTPVAGPPPGGGGGSKGRGGPLVYQRSKPRTKKDKRKRNDGR
jgi:hypothetical protein